MEFYWIGSCRCITETDHLFEPTNRKTLAPATWKTTAPSRAGNLLFLLGKVDVGAKIKSEYPRSGRSLSRPEHIQYVLETESYLNRILKSMNQRDWSSFDSTTVKPVYNLMGPEHIQYVLERVIPESDSQYKIDESMWTDQRIYESFEPITRWWKLFKSMAIVATLKICICYGRAQYGLN